MPITTIQERQPMNGDATRPGFRSFKQSSTRKYKWLSLLFAVLNVGWIILLINMGTALMRPEESCNSTETHQTEARAESMCLPCSYLGHEPAALCCADSLQVWRNYVTAFVNVEFARSKRNPEGKARTKRSLPDPPSLRKRADGKYVLDSIPVKDSGSYIVIAEVTLDFSKTNRTSNATCSIERGKNEESSFVLFKETVSACSLKSPNETCKAPISIGGNSLLKANDIVYLIVDRSPDLVNATTAILKVV